MEGILKRVFNFLLVDIQHPLKDIRVRRSRCDPFWVHLKMTYMTFVGFEKMAIKAISKNRDGHRLVNRYQMRVDLYFTVQYHILGMF